MSMNWHNFFFASFDPAGFISVDKPPLALWIQVLAVKLFGFRPAVLLMPQALMGVASVWLLYHLVKRNFGIAPALIATLLFALMPISVAVNRSNVMDNTLLLVLLLAGWAILKATEESSAKILILAMGLVGLAFNVKMLAGLLLLPSFILVYLAMAKKPWLARIRDLFVACCVLLLVSLSWSTLVQLTEPDQRPYIGSSRNNSMFELIAGHNAMDRIISPSRSAASEAVSSATQLLPSTSLTLPTTGELANDPRAALRELRLRLFVRAATGPLRLFAGQMAAQVGWFAPIVLFGLACWVGLVADWQNRPPAPTLLAQIQLAHRRKISLWFWIGWLLSYLLVYSYLGGISHYYYLSTLAPAWAALSGIAFTAIWSLRGRKTPISWLLPIFPLIAAAWQFHVQIGAMAWSSQAGLWSQPEAWLNAVHWFLLLSALGAALMMLIARWRAAQGGELSASRLDGAGLGWAFAALLLVPICWSLSSVLSPASGVLPSADLYRWQILSRDPTIANLTRFGRLPDHSRLIEFLNREQAVQASPATKDPSDGAANRKFFLLATSTTSVAAPIIILTGQAVMARGGYHGLDPATSPAALRQLVLQGQLRFALLNDVNAISRRLGADLAGAEVAAWIRSNGKLVDPLLWRNEASRSEAQLYDLRDASK